MAPQAQPASAVGPAVRRQIAAVVRQEAGRGGAAEAEELALSAPLVPAALPALLEPSQDAATTPRRRLAGLADLAAGASWTIRRVDGVEVGPAGLQAFPRCHGQQQSADHDHEAGYAHDGAL